MCLQENYKPMGRFALWFFLAFCFSKLTAQQSCKIWVAKEVTTTTHVLSVGSAIPQSGPLLKPWTNLNNASSLDGNAVEINYSDQGLSRKLSFSNLALNIPPGAKINYITVTIVGRSEGMGSIKDYEIRLRSGATKSDNLAGKGYNTMNVWAKSNNYKSWKYGFKSDWGVNWTESMVNSPDFGLDIQIINVLPKTIKALIDHISIEVEYTPLATYCLSDCFPIYIDPVSGAVAYEWHLPQDFELISKSDKSNIIDLKVAKASPGIHQVCVDAIDADGNILTQCCRDLRIKNCTPSIIGNFVWHDVNYNGLQDSGENGLANVKVSLFKTDHTLVKTTNTNSQGAYTFNNIVEGDYYLSVDKPSGFMNTKSNLGNLQLNSDFADGGSRSNNIFIPFGSNITDLDFGFVKELTIGDFVWEDNNFDGIQNTGEKGIADVKVNLLNEMGDTIAQQITNAQGLYKFTNIPASKYSLHFKNNIAFVPTKTISANTSSDSDIDFNGRTALLNFENTASNLTIDAGYFQYGRVGNYIWSDSNFNGLQDPTEAGSGNIPIILRHENGALLDTTFSDENGAYFFDKVVPGNYTIQVLLPELTEPTIITTGPNGSDLKTIGNAFLTDPFVVGSGQVIDDLDFGYNEIKSSICGLAWFDENNDGSYDIPESVASDVAVVLFDGDQNLISTTATDLDGKYCFNNLRPGNYFVSFVIETSFQFTDANKVSDDIDSDVLDRISIGSTEIISLSAGDTIQNVFAGISLRSKIGDYIWLDANYNGLQDTDEKGVPDIEVSLWDETNTFVEATTTDENGGYGFVNIVKGVYKIAVAVPANLLVTNLVGFEDLNSDLDSDGTSQFFAVELGVDKINIDGGLIGRLVLGDFVWEDSNANGIQDFGEHGLEGVEVIVRNENFNLAGFGITDENGNYLFNDLPALKYRVFFRAAEGYLPTFKDQLPDDELDSDIDINGITDLYDFTNEEEVLHIDGGFYKEACIGDFVWFDANENGLQDTDEAGLGEVLLVLYNENDEQVKILVTGENGAYEFCGLEPGKYYIVATPISDYAPTIEGQSSVLFNDNGIYRTNVFELFSSDVLNDLDIGFIYRPKGRICGIVWQDANADGLYDTDEAIIEGREVVLLDTALDQIASATTGNTGYYCFDQLPPGGYFIKFQANDNEQFTFVNVGLDDEIDSDADGISGDALSELIVISGGDEILNVFAGMIARSSIGDFAWFDSDKNGLQDVTEMGIPQVGVSLLDENGSIIQNTITGFDGKYLFENLLRGNYFVKFEKNPSLDFTIQHVDDITGSDADIDGMTSVINLEPGVDNLNVDAGFALKGGGLAGIVWQDVDKDHINTNADKLLTNVVVKLFDENNDLVSSKVTDGNGEYVFFPIPSGNYFVKFDSISHFTYTLADINLIYSDVDHSKGRGTTPLITILDGIVTGGVDCGLSDTRGSISGSAWIDVKADGIRNDVETVIKNLKVKVFSDSILVDSVFTDSLGNYTFEKLPPSSYVIKFDTFQNYAATIFHAGSDTLKDSDINTLFCTDTIILPACVKHLGINAGYRGFGSIIGEAFIDLDENGLKDDGPLGLDNIEVTLLDQDNNVVEVDTTSDGKFTFGKVLVGKYKISVKRPLFYIFTAKDVDGNISEEIDSDVLAQGLISAISDEFMVTLNQTLSSLDFGLVFRTPMISSIRGQIWKDSLVDGIRTSEEESVSGVEVILYNSLDVEIKRTTSNIEGKYIFANLLEGFYYIKALIGEEDKIATFLNEGVDTTIDNDFVTIDSEEVTSTLFLAIASHIMHLDLGITNSLSIGDFVWDDRNNNGIQDADETGIPNVNIEVERLDGRLVATGISEADGSYLIKNIPSGQYRLGFAFPANYTPAKLNVGAMDFDSDIDESGKTLFQLFQPGIKLDVDAGFVQNACIGDRVWVDFNSNGFQNTGEPGFNGTIVKLYTESGEFVYETLTAKNEADEDGRYKMTEIKPGRYYLEFINTPNYKITLQNIGGSEENSDIDSSGKTAIFEILPGENRTDIDAGFYLPGCIGNKIWIDLNKDGIQDEDEPGMPDVDIFLYNASGFPIDTGRTNEDGMYIFENLVQGLYFAEFKVSPPYVFTLIDQGTEDIDNDADEFGITPLISLAHGAKYYDLDAGVYLMSSAHENVIKGAIPETALTTDSYNKILKVNPNPALREVRMILPFENGTFEIINSQGEILDRLTVTDKNFMYNVRNFKAGVYQVQYYLGEKICRGRFIKVD